MGGGWGRQIAELNEKLGGIDVRNLDRERKKLITQQDELIREVGQRSNVK